LAELISDRTQIGEDEEVGSEEDGLGVRRWEGGG